MKAIPTHYNGHEFRSRLEAEVAYFLDAIDWDWEYEPKSFLLPGGYHYIPDFWIPGQNMWVEARGYKKRGSEQQLVAFAGQLDEHKRFLRLSNQRNKGVALFIDGKWTEAALRPGEDGWVVEQWTEADQQIRIKVSKSKVRFLRPGRSRYCKIDRLLEYYEDGKK